MIDYLLLLLVVASVLFWLRGILRRQPKGNRIWFRWYDNVYLTSFHWQQHRRLKFLIYGRRCRECGETRGVIQLHHLNYKHMWKEQLFSFRDTIPLCPICHAKRKR